MKPRSEKIEETAIMRDHTSLTTSGSAPSKAGSSPRRSKFSLAANYDSDLVPQLARYPVDEVYGKFPTDGISGGRPRYLATPLSKADLSAYIRLLGRHGIAFNYLLNGACFGNREWTRSWQKGVTALLERLGEMGVSRHTVSTPRMFEERKNLLTEMARGEKSVGSHTALERAEMSQVHIDRIRAILKTADNESEDDRPT